MGVSSKKKASNKPYIFIEMHNNSIFSHRVTQLLRRRRSNIKKLILQDFVLEFEQLTFLNQSVHNGPYHYDAQAPLDDQPQFA